MLTKDEIDRMQAEGLARSNYTPPPEIAERFEAIRAAEARGEFVPASLPELIGKLEADERAAKAEAGPSFWELHQAWVESQAET